MKTVTLAPGKWNQIILALAGAAHQAKDELVAKELHSLIGNILDGQEDTSAPGPVQRAYTMHNGYNIAVDLTECVTRDTLYTNYHTILTYLALFHPDYLRSIDYKDPKTTQRDGYWLMHHYSGNTGVAPAPKFFEKFHITELKTYPVHALRDCFSRTSMKVLTSR